MKKIICLSICFLIIVSQVACISTYGYREYGHYDNFNIVENDFQSICQLLSVESNDSYYYIKVVNENADDKEIADSSQIELTDMKTKEKLNISETDQKHLRNILKNSYGYVKGGLHGFCWISVQDGTVTFEYDAIGCGVVATSNIEDFISGLENGSNERLGYEKLSDGWYTYYR